MRAKVAKIRNFTVKFAFKILAFTLFSSSVIFPSAVKADLADEFEKSQCRLYYSTSNWVGLENMSISCVAHDGWVWGTLFGSQYNKLGGVGISTNTEGLLRTIKANQDWTILTEYYCKTGYSRSIEPSACETPIKKRIHIYTGETYYSADSYNRKKRNERDQAVREEKAEKEKLIPKKSYGWWKLQNQQEDLYKNSPGYQKSLEAYKNIRQ